MSNEAKIHTKRGMYEKDVRKTEGICSENIINQRKLGVRNTSRPAATLAK